MENVVIKEKFRNLRIKMIQHKMKTKEIIERTNPNVFVLSNEMRNSTDVWLMKVNRPSSNPTVAKSSVSIDRTFKYGSKNPQYYILRCVRQAAN
jgi:hypothetical protein